MSHHFITVQQIKSCFPAAFYEKGYHYYRQRRVAQLKIIHNDHKFQKISATVNGGDVYHVLIEIHHSGKNVGIRGVCTCPIAINCKHVVATLLMLIHPAGKAEKTKRTPVIKQETRVDTWLQELTRTLTPDNTQAAKVAETYSLYYLLTPSSARLPELRVKLSLIKHHNTGNLRSAKIYNHAQRLQQMPLLPQDKELIAKLEAVNHLTHPTGSHTHYLLKDDIGEKLLSELIATGRCHWLSLRNPPMTRAPDRIATLKWHLDSTGFQELCCYLDDKPIDVFSIDRLWYLDQDKWAIGLLETGLDHPTTTLLLTAPKIPLEQAQAVADTLSQNTHTAHIQRPTILTNPTIEKVQPIPCLRLFQAAISRAGNYKNHWRASVAHAPLAALTFDYQGVIIPWETDGKIVCQIKGEHLMRIQRDKKTEARAYDELVSSHLTLLSQIPGMAHLNKKWGQYFLIENGVTDPLDFTQRRLPQLRDQGWRIDIAQDYPYQIIDTPIDEWYSAITESSGYDWFDLELGILLNGEKINLLPVLQKLVRKLQMTKHLDATSTEPLLAELPDGRYLALPSERVRHILNILVELYDRHTLMDEDSLRISKYHATRLLELENACGAANLRWFGGENIRKLARKLAQFTGIATVAVPEQFQGQLRPYQIEGLSWLQFLREYDFGGILADDMGLGKTVQALAHLTVEKASGRMKNPNLVIAPTSLMFNWRMEAERFSPDLKVLVLHGSERKQRFDHILQYDLILTTYPLLVRDKEFLLQQQFHVLILDEAQCIKNSKSLATQIAIQIQAKHRLCLTGTPMENHLGELWSLFHFMMPGLLGEQRKFNQLFRVPIEKQGDQTRREHLNRRLAPFLLRRTKDKVVKELPEKVETTHYVELEGPQRDLYETIRVMMQQKVRQEIAKLGLGRSHIILLDALLKLRQVCCDPRLLKINSQQKTHAQSAKLVFLMTLLEELLEEGRRILLFSQFTEMLGLIEQELQDKKIRYVKLTGQTKDREKPIQQFQQGEVPLFLISLKAGGTGLNLTAADTVIHYDPWWNPAVENQATDRAHRIGQSKTVFVYKLVAQGTVEEKILEMQQRKQALMAGLFSDKTTEQLALTEHDLQVLFEPLDPTQ